MSSLPSVLIYDGRKKVFRTAVSVLTYGMEDVVSVPWESDPIQRFLEAQFGCQPFVFLFIEGDSVHAGETAVKRVLTARGIPPSLIPGFERLYSTIADPFGRIVHGEAPADIHGTFDLDPDARRYIDAIRRPDTQAGIDSCE
ncbi:hypothetical protein ACERIT_03880 [Halopenitus sp. H-Gu1]|uniref:hypothetical protein n=1 Tax=Halopenitus sp. H-Gu1 TaxID=3242697 RepID=UPI00359D60CF